MLWMWMVVAMFVPGLTTSEKNIEADAGTTLPFPKSCLDHRRSGRTVNGHYPVLDNHGNGYTVYCDFTSEPGMVWTLVTSWSRAFKDFPQFQSKALSQNAPVNQHSPNWSLYRLPLARMMSLKTKSTHWRATCSFQSHRLDYKDYVRANFHDFDVMTYNGQGQCKMVELINIRGHAAAHTTVPFWQTPNSFFLHTDSHWPTASSGCSYAAVSGAVNSEDNFGYYATINPKFRCMATPSSTTQYWFGAAL